MTIKDAGYDQSYDGLPLQSDNFGGCGESCDDNPLVSAAASDKGYLLDENFPRCRSLSKMSKRKCWSFLFTSVEIQCQYDGKEKPIEYNDEGKGTIFLLEIFEE